MVSKTLKEALKEELTDATSDIWRQYEEVTADYSAWAKRWYLEKYVRMWLKYCEDIAAEYVGNGLSGEVVSRVFKSVTGENVIF